MVKIGITKEFVKSICKIGQGNECCRYIVVGREGFQCAKYTNIQRELDHRVKENRMTAQGDNCDGYPAAMKEGN